MYTITPLKVGAFAGFEKSMFTFITDFGVKIDCPILAYVIRGEGKTILVDTGPANPTLAKEMNHMAAFSQPAEEKLDAQLKAQGIDPASIETVVLTHLHWDHCYNLEVLPKARFIVQKKELHFAMDPIPWFKAQYERDVPGKPNANPPWVSVYNRIQIVDGDFDLAPGIRLVLTPGHCQGLQGVRVQTKEGVYMVAQDMFPLFENYERMIPPGIHVDLREWLDSYKKIKAQCDFILPGHDYKALERKVYG